jgi:hypothetical protein
MGWKTGRSTFDPWQRQRNFPLASVSRPALGPTQPPVQWVPGVLSPGLKHGRGMTLTTHPHLVPRSRMSRSYTSSPPPPSAIVVCSGTALAFFIMVQYISYLQISRKPMIQLGGKYYTIFSFEFRILRKLVGLIKMCLNETYSTVCIGKNLS